MLNKKALGVLALASSGFVLSNAADASLKLEIDDATDAGVEVTIFDNVNPATLLNGATTDTFIIPNPGDTQADTGKIGITTANTQGWEVSTATGLSNAGGVVNIAGAGIMDLAYAMTGTGEISLRLTDTFTLSSLSGSSLLDGNYVLEGNSFGASVTANIWEDGVLISSEIEALSSSTGSYSLSDSFDFLDASAVIALELVFSTDAGTTLSTTSGDYLLTVPEPATLGLLGLGLAGFGIARRKKA